MNPKRTYRGEERQQPASSPKRPRTFNAASNGGTYLNHDTYSPLAHGEYTIAWICALHLELNVSRAMLDEEHPLPPNQPGDDNIYVLGRIDQHNVVMTSLPGKYGTTNAAIVATNLKRSFPNIRATLMVGIGGGSPTQANLYLGDVVVGTRVMQYDMGKMVAGGVFQETADAKTPARLLDSAVSALRSKHGSNRSSSRMTSLLRTRLPNVLRPDHPDRLFQASYEHPLGAATCTNCDLEKLQPRAARLSDQPSIHYGVIASGNRVMKDGKARDGIAQRLSALCFEMEAAGMMDNLQCLPIRGICDYSDSHKNKEWQGYSAATAAAYARELLEGLPPSSRTLDRAPTYVTGVCQPDAAVDNALERRKLLLKCLEFPQIDARRTNIRAAHTRTCRWLLGHSAYQDWLDPEKQSQNHGFLWMRGKAGAGKSTMMKFMYLETKKVKKHSMAVLSFFFNARGDYLERSISGMYRSLLLQLLQEFSDLQSALDNTDIVPRNQENCPGLNVLKELLSNAVMALGQRCLTCFVDALDECDELEVRDMVHFFEELAENATDDGIQFRICFSSRPYPYIDIHRGILLTLEKESGHGEDLAQYVKSRLRIEHPPHLEELQSHILKKAAGVFMWVVLVVEILNNESSRGALALRKKLSEIPAELSKLFRSMLARDQHRTESLQLCILWILFAKRPLSPAEFRHALWAGLLEQRLVDPELPDHTHMDAVKLVASSSKGLAEITKSDQPVVQFIHESVRDFLVKEKGVRDLWPELGFDWEGHSHEILKRCCTTYLNHPSVQAIIVARKGGDAKRNATDGKGPFLKYAGQQVLYHADAAAPVAPQEGFLIRFFASGGIEVICHVEGWRYGSSATPLYVLADKGLGNLIRSQMERDPATDAPGERYRYPIFAAIANGHKSATAALLGLSSTVCDGVDITEGLSYRGGQGRTPLSWAAQEGRLRIVELLIQGGADLDEVDRRGYTPLCRALEHGHGAVARLLIDEGADIEVRNGSGFRALLLALRYGHAAIAHLLIYKGADVEARDNTGATALIWALRYGHEAIARLLIDGGADIEARDSARSTALIWALEAGYEAVVQLLVNRGVDIEARNYGELTALHLASRNGHEAIVQLLIDVGADIEARARYDLTALHLAARNGHKATVQLLVDKGADIEARDNTGSTALIWASEAGYGAKGHEVVAQLLIDNGADIEAQHNTGSPALIWASWKGHEAVVQLLINNGADIETRDESGMTALGWASRQGHEAIVQFLIANGATGDA
ncbi:ankyrin repeat-containing domain protein [Chaetomium fimeti]|uniref:Ankyrin repeat-containing domain protein n=1 Tax=Chaetomium fimeti TaxID=1854472 RepID=A0AAE0HK16_9PEZI|nr:ankyrin repeat-containing domain protein [Chaetomium fimeti]